MKRGEELQRAGAPDDALTCFERATECDPDLVVAWMARSWALRGRRRVSEALGCCDRALELDEDNGEAWFMQGLLLNELGRSLEARWALQRAERLGETLAGRALRSLGW